MKTTLIVVFGIPFAILVYVAVAKIVRYLIKED